MKIVTEKLKINIDVRWTFDEDGLLQRSSVVAGMQAEIRKSNVVIYKNNAGKVYEGTHTGNRQQRRRHALAVMGRILTGT